MTHTGFNVTNESIISLNNSKSLLIRQLIANFIYNGTLPAIADRESEDVKTVHDCLSAIAESRLHTPGCTVAINVRDCGAAYRFLLAVLASTPGQWLLTGTPRLLQRPIRPLVSALQSIGAEIDDCAKGLLVSGRELHAAEMTIHCEESSQYASALLMIAPRIGLQQLNILPAPPPSAPYIDMTRAVVEETLRGCPPRTEADWSTAAFWYAYALLAPDITRLNLKNLRLDSLQGDKAVAEFFRGLGVSSEQTEQGVAIESTGKHYVGGLTIDLTNTPDLAPVLAATAVLHPFNLTMHGISTLNFKESNRLDVLMTTLAQFAPSAIICENGRETFTVCGHNRYRLPQSPLALNTWNDHRMAMAFSLLSLQYDIHLSDIQCVKKSYPQFANYISEREDGSSREACG